MKCIKIKLLRNNKGMTLVEIIVVFLLSFMMLFLIYLIFSTSMTIYDKTSIRVDAQTQFRLVMDILEKEVGNAKTVSLVTIDPTSVSNPAANYTYIYLKPESGSTKKALYVKKHDVSEKALSPPYPLPEFTMGFSPDSSRTIRVILHAKGASDFIGSVMVQNTTISTTTSGNAILYESY